MILCNRKECKINCKSDCNLISEIWYVKSSERKLHWKIEIRTELHSRKEEDLFRCWFHLIFLRNELLSSTLRGRSIEVKSSHVLWIAISLTDKQIMHLPSDHVFQDLLVPLSWHADPIHDSIRRSFPVDRRKERVYFAHYSLRRCKNHYSS